MVDRVFIFVLLFIGNGFAFLSSCQDPSFCQNGGTCVMNSASPAAKRCSDDEVFHSGSCFSFVRVPLQWNDAARKCTDRNATLPLPQTSDDQKFLSSYIQGVLAAGPIQDRSTFGVWISVRSKVNGSTPAWVSYPGSYLVKNLFWKPGEPNLFPDWNDVCVSLQSDTMFLQWMSQSCGQANYAVCQRALDVSNENEAFPQCSCPPDFVGQQCEEQSSGAPSQTSSLQQVVCANQALSFSCPNGETIVVDYANYGAVAGYSCCTSNLQGMAMTCSNPDSLQTLVNRCQGLTYCNITNVSELFPETSCLVKEELQLQYRMRCASDVHASCPSDSFYMSGRCYAISIDSKGKNKVTQSEASEKCRLQGGQLPTSISQLQEDEIVRQAKNSNFWIGLVQTPAGPAWNDGNRVSYTPPGSNLSAEFGCTVLSIGADGSGRWVSTGCDSTAYYICQFAPNSDDRPKQKVNLQTTTPGQVFQGTNDNDSINNIFGPTKYCPEQTARGVKFPKTRICTDAVIQCPDPENIVGTISRFCNCRTGQWDPPDTSNCTHKWVAEVRNSLDRGDPAEDVSAQLATNLNKTVSSLYGGDILGSVSISSDVLNLARNQYSVLTDRNQRFKRVSNFTGNLGTSGDNLLSEVVVPVWTELDDARRIDHASTLMGVLEQTTLLLADYSLQGQTKLNYDNWAMEVEVKQPETFNPATARGMMPVVPMDDASGGIAQGATAFGAQPFEEESLPAVSFSFSNSPTISLPSLNTLKTSSAESNNNPMLAVSQTQFSPSSTGDGPTASLDRNRLHLGYYVFTTFGSILSTDPLTIINSHIIGASVDDATRSLQLPSDQPVTFTFYHLQKTGVANPRCVFWNLDTKQWSSEGCELLSTSRDSSQCACNHLTSFAILMDISGRLSSTSGSPGAALDVVSTIGCALSIVCLVLCVIVFTFFRSLYNVRNTIHRNLCLCLLIAELTFVIGIDRTGNRTGCGVVAILLHFFFTSAFCWMLLEGYQLYMMLIQVFEPSKTRLLLYYIFCYGFPAVLVAVTAGVAWNNYGTDTYCWINTATPTIWAFVVPVIIVIIANVTFLFIALRVVLSVKSRDRTTSDRIVGWLKGSVMLLCLLGITWVFGFLTAVKGGTGTVFAWIFTILNCTQGVFIFILHVLLNEKVRLVVMRWIRTGVCCLPEKTSAYNSRSYLSSRQRILNMVKAQQMSRSAPSTASTDDKDKQLTPTSKTNEWLRQISQYQSDGGISSGNSQEGDAISCSSDPRGSGVLEITTEPLRVAPVKRKKFPLECGEQERRSTIQDEVNRF